MFWHKKLFSRVNPLKSECVIAIVICKHRAMLSADNIKMHSMKNREKWEFWNHIREFVSVLFTENNALHSQWVNHSNYGNGLTSSYYTESCKWWFDRNSELWKWAVYPHVANSGMLHACSYSQCMHILTMLSL